MLQNSIQTGGIYILKDQITTLIHLPPNAFRKLRALAAQVMGQWRCDREFTTGFSSRDKGTLFLPGKSKKWLFLTGKDTKGRISRPDSDDADNHVKELPRSRTKER